MKFRTVAAGLLVSIIAFSAAPPVSAADEKGKPKSATARGADSLTGCVDEYDGSYVLVEPGSMRRVAALRAEGFEQEGFAKYLGHKVNVRGRLASEGDSRIIRVRSIVSLADVCGASTGNQWEYYY